MLLHCDARPWRPAKEPKTVMVPPCTSRPSVCLTYAPRVNCRVQLIAVISGWAVQQAAGRPFRHAARHRRVPGRRIERPAHHRRGATRGTGSTLSGRAVTSDKRVRGRNTQSGRLSPYAKHLGDQRGIDKHVGSDGVVADGVNPGVAGAQGYDRLDHARPEILEKDEY
jgi:hypothetical protein